MTYHPPTDPDLPEEEDARDGVASLESEITCPYCGANSTVALDPGSGAVQDYIEDCQVCCQPCRFFVTYHASGTAEVEVERADEG